MRTIVGFILIVVFSAGAGRVQAQSLQGTAWKLYVDALHDTLTLHIAADTSYTTSSAGELIVRATCKVVKDTITMRDFAGQYACPDGEGVYRYTVEGDYLTFFLVSDPCSNRSEAINGTKWRKTEEEKK
jgi:hypothetical protein